MSTLLEQTLNFTVDPQVVKLITERMYQNPFEQTWAREVIQNSVDAKASRISITNEYNRDTNVSTFTVEDDGIGMDANIIINKFLSLGGSYKEDETQAVGGFGIAKTIVLGGDAKQANPEGKEVFWYVITTKKNKNSGENESFYFDSEMLGKESLKPIGPLSETGTKIVINRRGYFSNNGFRKVIESSNVVPIIYNGDELQQLRRARKQEFDTLGENSMFAIHYKKAALSHQKGYAIYRINGVFQFQEYIDSTIPGALIIEITTDKKPSDADYPLTPNREQLRTVYSESLYSVFNTFKVYQAKESIEDYSFEIYNNPFFNPNKYENMFEENIKTVATVTEMGEKKLEAVVLIEEEEDIIQKTKEEEEKQEEELFNEENVSLNKYEREQKRIEETRRKTAEVEKVFAAVIKELRIDSDDKIAEYMANVSPVLKSIAVKKDRKVNSQISLYNPKNVKVLLAFKLFIDLIFEINKGDLNRFEYVIGWTMNGDRRVEFLEKDSEKYILLNPIGLSISDTRLFTHSIIQNLLYEMIKNDYYRLSEYSMQKYFKLMEEKINPNIRLFERTAKRVLKG